MSSKEIVLMQAGGQWHQCTVWIDNGEMYFDYGYNPALKVEIKGLEKKTWHGGKPPNWNKSTMYYSAPLTPRNEFTINYLMNDKSNPYKLYRTDPPKIDLEPRFNKQHGKVMPPYAHQGQLVSHCWHRRYCICAAQMRTGKTLCMIYLMEKAGCDARDIWYIGPRSAIAGVSLDMDIWGCKVQPLMMTWSSMTKTMENWDGSKAPKFVFFDESSLYKSVKSQRTNAALHLAHSVRSDHGMEGMVTLWTGTPAPKHPVDWWTQCEIACPGYLLESNPFDFEGRLAVRSQGENPYGGTYWKVKTWLDNPKKCPECGEFKDHSNHKVVPWDDTTHNFKKSNNEVSALYERLKGLSINILKKDCLDLPDKVFTIRRIAQSQTIKRYSKSLAESSISAAHTLILQRELHDGFLYEDVKQLCNVCNGGSIKKCSLLWNGGPCPKCNGVGYELKECELCKGSGEEYKYTPIEDVSESGVKILPSFEIPIKEYKDECHRCKGTGVEPKVIRVAQPLACPKTDELKKDIEDHEEVGRLVVYAGFQGSIDKIYSVFEEAKWKMICLDGRGLKGDYGDLQLALKHFAKIGDDYPEKLAFIGHPKTGGMGISLSASPSTIFWSNSFDGQDRMQAVERIHDPGMDIARGANIIDYVHGPFDQYVLDNLAIKEKLQKITMGDINGIL